MLRGGGKKESPRKADESGLQVNPCRNFLTGIIIPVRKFL